MGVYIYYFFYTKECFAVFCQQKLRVVACLAKQKEWEHILVHDFLALFVKAVFLLNYDVMYCHPCYTQCCAML